MKKIHSQNGYSLLEVIVSAGLFAFLIIISLDVFYSVNQSQKSALASQNIQENLRFALEVMSREIRQAVRSDNSCLTGPAVNRVFNFEIISGHNALIFKKVFDSKEYCISYFLENDRIRIRRMEKPSNIVIADDYITSNQIKIDDLRFEIFDNVLAALPEDKSQPRVNLVVEAEAIAPDLFKQPTLLQTTISSRVYGDTIYAQ